MGDLFRFLKSFLLVNEPVITENCDFGGMLKRSVREKNYTKIFQDTINKRPGKSNAMSKNGYFHGNSYYVYHEEEDERKIFVNHS